MMEHEELQYKEEIARGQRAEKAYHLYVKDFLEKQYVVLYQAFLDATTDTEVLTTKRLIDAVQQLEVSIRLDVETGKMAAISLNKGENNG